MSSVTNDNTTDNTSNAPLNKTNTTFSTNTHLPNLNETIQIYLRLRPCRNGSFDHPHLDISSSSKQIDIRVPVEDQGYVNNTIRKHSYKFDKIFDSKTTQETIFNEVAKEVIDSTIDGYNGTIFAYGQTGSGKTYTITGGVESISQRGIIPRALSYIFEETKKRTLFTWKIYISYLEIYNNDGFDLLHDSTEKKYELEALPRVRIRENQFKQLILSGLSIHQIDNFQEGMALLMLGDDNRVVAETPKNDASTRSHCLFMIQIESQKIGEDVKTLSKLHIVDLSGSEKPSKSELSGVRMTEALNINISLFYLESVIIEINNKSKYIPYRNSMMTMCLRDSIGGNCKTRMIANLSSDFDDVFESLSTCRFAQRVALVKNTAVVNEVVDPNILIQKQKGEIEELKNELAMLKGKNQKSFLEKEDIDECKKIVEEFLKDETYTKKIEVKDRLMIQECFNIIKMKYKDMEKQVAMHVNKDEIVLNGTQDKERIIMLENENKRLNAEIDKLKEMLKNREDEMKVVLENMEQNKTQLSLSTINNNNNLNNTSMNGHRTLLSRIQQEDNEAISKIKNNILGDLVKFDSISNVQGNNDSTILLNLNDSSTKNDTNSVSAKSTTTYVDVPTPLIKDINSANSYITNPNSEEINIGLFKQEGYAFNFFKANYYLREVEVENKEKIKNKMAEGKQLAAEYPKLEAKIEKIKKAIENVRKLKIVSEDSKDKVDEYTKQEETLLNEFTKIKPIRQSMRDKLKNMRNEITTMQTIDTNFQVTRIKNYEFWKETMLKKLDFESKHGKINLVTGKASIKA
jgi:kinesin family protein 6/9